MLCAHKSLYTFGRDVRLADRRAPRSGVDDIHKTEEKNKMLIFAMVTRTKGGVARFWRARSGFEFLTFVKMNRSDLVDGCRVVWRKRLPLSRFLVVNWLKKKRAEAVWRARDDGLTGSARAVWYCISGHYTTRLEMARASPIHVSISDVKKQPLTGHVRPAKVLYTGTTRQLLAQAISGP